MNARLLDAVRRIQKEYQEEDFGIGNASPLSIEILPKPFPSKFKLPNLDKYKGKSYPRNNQANFQTTILLQDVSNLEGGEKDLEGSLRK